MRMEYSLGRIYRNENIRTAVGMAIGLSVLAVLADSAVDIVPIAVLSVGMLSYSVADDRYDLPCGTGRIAYGVGVSAAGAVFWVAYSVAWLGGVLTAAGLWFVFDGSTAVVYGGTDTEHEYVSGIDEDSEEAMSRMMTLRKVYVAVKDASEPRTPEEIAEEDGISEERVESALGYLESKGRVVKVGDGYRIEPQRWGRLTPVVGFLGWLPRRVFRPFRRVVGGG